MLRDDRWHTVTRSNASPVERERDRHVEIAIEGDGRPLSALGIVAQQRGPRWEIEILSRDALLERLDTRGRTTEDAGDRELCKDLAAWIRGLDPDTCPELITWEGENGTRSLQRATIARPKGGRAC